MPYERTRRVLAAIIDLTAMSAFALGAFVITFFMYMAATGNDFDGPSEYDNLFDCWGWGVLSFFAFLYGLLEAIFFAAVGKWVLGLRIQSATPFALSRARGVRRWLIKYFPLILLCIGAWMAYFVLKRNLPWNPPNYDSARFYRLDDLMWKIIVAVTSCGILAHLVFCLLTHGGTLHDWAAGTTVAKRSVTSDFPTGARGFEPILRDG